MTRNCLQGIQLPLPKSQTQEQAKVPPTEAEIARWFDTALRRLLRRPWPPPDSGAEAVYVGWQRYLENPELFQSESHVLHWCKRRAGWLAIADYWHRRSTPLPDDLVDQSPGVEEEMCKAELRQTVRNCLAELSQEERDLLDAKIIRGLPLRKIATKRYRKSSNANILKVWRRIRLALSNLRTQLTRCGIDGRC